MPINSDKDGFIDQSGRTDCRLICLKAVNESLPTIGQEMDGGKFTSLYMQFLLPKTLNRVKEDKVNPPKKKILKFSKFQAKAGIN